MAIGHVPSLGHRNWHGGTDQENVTTVGSREHSLEEVAVRIGVAVEDLLAANPQVTDTHQLSAGVRIQIPSSSRQTAAGVEEESASDRYASIPNEESQTVAPLMKSKLSSASTLAGDPSRDQPAVANPAMGSPISPNDSRLAAINTALDSGDGRAAMVAAKKLIAELGAAQPIDQRLLNEARMSLAAGAMVAGKLDDARDALLAIPSVDLDSYDKTQYEELGLLLKQSYNTAFRQAFQADTAPSSASQDRGKEAADQAASLLQYLKKAEPKNTEEIANVEMRLANALLLGGHYREAQKTLAPFESGLLPTEHRDYLAALQQEIHAQQIGALTAAFGRDIQSQRYGQAAENATAIVNDLRKYFPDSKGQLTAARLDQSAARLLNGDYKGARQALSHISQSDLKHASSEIRNRYKDLDKAIGATARDVTERADMRHRLETIRMLVASGDKDTKNDALGQAQELLRELQSRHPENTDAIENMKLAVADVALQAGYPSEAVDLAKKVSAETNDDVTKDRAELFEAHALLESRPPQPTEAAKLLHVVMQDGSDEETRQAAREGLISIEHDHLDTIARKAEAEIQGLNDFKKQKYGGGKFEVEFTDFPEEKAAFKQLGETAKGAKLAAAVMSANQVTVEELQAMDEQHLAALKGVNGTEGAKLLQNTLNLPDARLIGRNEFQTKRFTWETGKLYIDTSLYDSPGDKLLKALGEKIRAARSQEQEWENEETGFLRVYGKCTGRILDAISKVDEVAKDGIKASRAYYQRLGGVLGKMGEGATFLVDQAVSTVTMPATILDYKATDEERLGALQGTLLMVATAGMLKAGGPAISEVLGRVGNRMVTSRWGQAVAKSSLGRAAKAFEETTFAKGVDRFAARTSAALRSINRLGRSEPTIASTGGEVPPGGTGGSLDTQLPASPAPGDLDPRPPKTNERNAHEPQQPKSAEELGAADTLEFPKVEGASDLEPGETLEMPAASESHGATAMDAPEIPAVRIQAGGGGGANGPGKAGRSVEDVVGEILGDKSAGQIRSSLTPGQLKRAQNALMDDEYQRMVSAKQRELKRFKLDGKEARAVVRNEYRGARLREVLRERESARYTETDHRQIALGDYVYEKGYHGQSELKPATVSQADYTKNLDAAKGELVSENIWKSPDGKAKVIEDNYWHIRKSDIPGQTPLGLNGDIRRFFFNVKPDQAIELANTLGTQLTEKGVTWQLKVPQRLRSFDRPDSGVLYISKADYDVAKKVVTDFADKHPDAFAKGTPAFTKEIRRGIGVAEEPMQDGLPLIAGGTHSFGSSRSYVIAEAILEAPENATKAEIVRLVRSKMEALNMDPDRPWLSKKTNPDDF